ncbi:MAG: VanW family protein [Bacillota bacterium]
MLPSRDGRKGPHRYSLLHITLGVIIFCLFLGSAGALVAGEARYGRPTRIGGIEVGGLTPSEARERLEQVLNWKERVMILETPFGEFFTLRYTELGLVPDIDASLARARVSTWWRSAPQQLELVVRLDEQVFYQTMEALKQAVECPPVSAALVFLPNGRVEVGPHLNGVILDTGALRQAVWQSGRWETLPGYVMVPVRALEPEVSQEDLQALGLRRKIAEFSTTYKANEPRAENVALSALAINGTLLAPGEVFSFNEIVGPRSAEKGYQLANVYYGHRIIQGVGGGVCQVSTTLYNAVLLANLELVQRFHHSMPVDYVPLGRDAAVSFDDGLDLKFRNNTSSHMLIRATADQGKLTFSIYGDAPEDLRVTITSRVVQTIPFGTETVNDPKVPAGEKVVTEGKVGMRVVAEATVFANGRETTRPLPASVYVPVPTLVRVGTGPNP